MLIPLVLDQTMLDSDLLQCEPSHLTMGYAPCFLQCWAEHIIYYEFYFSFMSSFLTDCFSSQSQHYYVGGSAQHTSCTCLSGIHICFNYWTIPSWALLSHSVQTCSSKNKHHYARSTLSTAVPTTFMRLHFYMNLCWHPSTWSNEPVSHDVLSFEGILHWDCLLTLTSALNFQAHFFYIQPHSALQLWQQNLRSSRWRCRAVLCTWMFTTGYEFLQDSTTSLLFA